MWKRKLAIIVSIVVVVILITVILVFLSSNSPKETLKADVKINSFNYTGSSNPGGIRWDSCFVLDYLNNGTIDVYNVTITFTTNSTYKLDREIEVYTLSRPHYIIGGFKMGEPYALGSIKSGEAKQFCGGICNDLTDRAKIWGFATTATLKSNNTILDQAIMNFP